jgi:hypothetical protein
MKRKRKPLLKNRSLSFEFAVRIAKFAKYVLTRKGKITQPTPVQLLVLNS